MKNLLLLIGYIGFIIIGWQVCKIYVSYQTRKQADRLMEEIKRKERLERQAKRIFEHRRN